MIKLDSVYLNNALAAYEVSLPNNSKKLKELKSFKGNFEDAIFMHNIYAFDLGTEPAADLLGIEQDAVDLLAEEAESKGMEVKELMRHIILQHVKELEYR